MKGEVRDGALLVLDATDTVATALADLEAGREVDLGDAVAGEGAPETLAVREPVAFGHKVALVAHTEGDAVRKYGEQIGVASAAIDPGEHVHTHNCESRRGRGDERADGSAEAEG